MSFSIQTEYAPRFMYKPVSLGLIVVNAFTRNVL